MPNFLRKYLETIHLLKFNLEKKNFCYIYYNTTKLFLNVGDNKSMKNFNSTSKLR